MSKNKRFNIVFLFVFMFFMIFTVGGDNKNVYAENNLSSMFVDKISYTSSAKSAYLMETTTGRILYEKNSEQKLPMASTTKIVTAITVLDNCENLDEVVNIKSNSVGIEGTSIYLREGEQLTVRELLYGLMLRSGNDASVALANHIGGSVENFCSMMNKLATDLGLENSNFVNPHGLDTEGHYTTAHDLAVITAYALQNEEFAKIVSTKNIVIGQGESRRSLANKNRLLGNLDGCIGVKTGFTNDAGRCLVSACDRDGLKLVCVVFNCGPMFEESSEMFELVYKNYKMLEIIPSYNTYDNINVENGTKNFVTTYSRAGFIIPVNKNEEANINVIIDIKPSIEAPVEKDTEVGKVEVYLGKHLLFSEKIYTMDKVSSRLLSDKVKDILDNWNA